MSPTINRATTPKVTSHSQKSTAKSPVCLAIVAIIAHSRRAMLKPLQDFWNLLTRPTPELRLLRDIDERTILMSLNFEALRAEVANIKDVAGSTKLLIQRLAKEIKDANDAGNQAEVDRIATELHGAANDLSNAVTENSTDFSGAPTDGGADPVTGSEAPTSSETEVS